MPKPLNWSSVNISDLQQIEKSQSTDFKLQYKVTYLGHSVTIESFAKLEKLEIQKLALERLKEQDLEFLSSNKKLEVDAKHNQDASKDTTSASHIALSKPGINLLEMAPPLRDLVLKNLTYEDLLALDKVLQKYRQIRKELEPNFIALKRHVSTQIELRKEIELSKEINEILKDHPNWTTAVDGWKNVTLEDKLWLLQLYELHNLGVKIPQITREVGLLNSDLKTTITASLDAITTLDWSFRNLQKCPRAICLLGNLQSLKLGMNELTTPPDVSKNVKLLELNLSNNPLTIPPNVSKNVNLQSLSLFSNKLTAPPNVSKNVNLQWLDLSYNKLTTPPDVSKNLNLQSLSLSSNKLTAPPDVSKNVNLQSFSLRMNQLRSPPDVSKNVNLTYLDLNQNQLTTCPDLSKNVNLEALYLEANGLCTEAEQALKKLKSEHKRLTILYY